MDSGQPRRYSRFSKAERLANNNRSIAPPMDGKKEGPSDNHSGARIDTKAPAPPVPNVTYATSSKERPPLTSYVATETAGKGAPHARSAGGGRRSSQETKDAIPKNHTNPSKEDEREAIAAMLSSRNKDQEHIVTNDSVLSRNDEGSKIAAVVPSGQRRDKGSRRVDSLGRGDAVPAAPARGSLTKFADIGGEATAAPRRDEEGLGNQVDRISAVDETQRTKEDDPHHEYPPAPGAYAVDGIAEGIYLDADTANISGMPIYMTENQRSSATMNVSEGSENLTIVAMAVSGEAHGEDDEAPIVFATKDTFMQHLLHSRRTQAGLCCLALLVVGLTVGLVVSKTSSSGDSEPSADQVGPASHNPWSQVGSDIDGEISTQFGSSVSLSGDGTRMAVGAPGDPKGARRGVVQVYELVDNDWALLEPDILVGSSSDYHGISTPQNRIEVELSKDGDRVAIGSSFHDGGDGQKGIGQVEIHRFNETGLWEREGNPIRGEAAMDFFGASVSFSDDGSVVAVGAPGNNNSTGKVRVFHFNKGKWEQRGFSIHGKAADEMAGGSVSLSANGDAVAVGATSRGRVGTVIARVFRYKSGDWKELGEGIEGGVGLYETGWSTSLSADARTVVVSNYYAGESGPEINSDEVNGDLVVMALQFDEATNKWTALGDNMHANAKGDKSGYFITLSGDGHLIGMGDPGRSVDGGKITGHAHIYKYNGQQWEQIGPNINGEAAGDMFGFSVALSADGSRFVIGAPRNRGQGEEHGRVKVFEMRDA